MPGPLDLHRVLASVPPLFEHWADGTRFVLRWCARHTGLPVVIVAAIALVISVRMARRWARFAVEVALALGLLLVASRLGWVSW
jgi:hypothetical protein